MIVQGLGAGMVVALMQAERGRDPDLGWLLFGPEDEQVVEALDGRGLQAMAAE